MRQMCEGGHARATRKTASRISPLMAGARGWGAGCCDRQLELLILAEPEGYPLPMQCNACSVTRAFRRSAPANPIRSHTQTTVTDKRNST